MLNRSILGEKQTLCFSKRGNFYFALTLNQCVFCADTKVLLKTTKTWDDNEFKALNIKNPEVTVLHITIKKGEILPLHKHIMTNIAYVVKGKLTVTAENRQQKTISKGGVPI